MCCYFCGLLNFFSKIIIFHKYCHSVKLFGCVSPTGPSSAVGASLTADPGVMSSIPALSHTFVENAQVIITRVILLLLLISIQWVVSYKRRYVPEVLVNCLSQACSGKKVWLGELTVST